MDGAPLPSQHAAHASSSSRSTRAALGARLLPRGRDLALRRATARSVAAPFEPVPRALRRAAESQPRPLPRLQEPPRERALRGVAGCVLGVSVVRLDPDAQPQSPQVRQPSRGRDHHVALFEEEHLARREHVLLRLRVLAVSGAERVRREGQDEEPRTVPGRSWRSGSRSSEGKARSLRSARRCTG